MWWSCVHRTPLRHIARLKHLADNSRANYLNSNDRKHLMIVVMCVQNSGVGDASLRHIARLPHLGNLSLAHCSLSGVALEHLSSAQVSICLEPPWSIYRPPSSASV